MSSRGLDGKTLGISTGHWAKSSGGATLGKQFSGGCGHSVFAGHRRWRASVLVVVSAIVVLHQCRIAMVEVHDTMGEEIFLVVEVDFLGRDTCIMIIR